MMVVVVVADMVAVAVADMVAVEVADMAMAVADMEVAEDMKMAEDAEQEAVDMETVTEVEVEINKAVTGINENSSNKGQEGNKKLHSFVLSITQHVKSVLL